MLKTTFKRLPVEVRFLLLGAGIEFLRAFLSTLAYLLDGVSTWLSYPVHILSETAGFLLLLATLGIAFGASRRSQKHGWLYLGISAGAFLFGGFFSLLWQALFLERGITGLELSMLVGSAIDSSFLPLAVAFLLGYFGFLSKHPDGKFTGYLDFQSVPVRATLAASLLILVYRLVGQILTTIDFVNESGFLYPGEIVTIILDFLLILATSAAGYFIALYARRRYLRAQRDYEAARAESKKEND